MKIDFVITWVDGSDPEWLEEKSKYIPSAETDGSKIRYRDMDILKYWFRAVCEYAPWVNKVYFITWGHLPEWLNTKCEKLVIVNHKDYIPHKFLPTFSSHPIELNMHRIEGLSEYFVYFNDDMFLNDYIKPEYFFKKGLPCDFAHVNNIYYSDVADICAHVIVNETWATNNHYSYIKTFLKHPLKFLNFKYPFKNNMKNLMKLENKSAFAGFENHHMASPYLKKSFEEVWKNEEALLERTSYNKLRSPLDVSQSIFRYCQLAKGEFYPVSKKSRGKFFHIGLDNDELAEVILNSSYKMICINDSPDIPDFEKAKEELIKVYEKKLPQKSVFEI